MLLTFIFLVLAGSEVAWSQRGCSRDRMRQCNDALLRSIQKRILDLSRQQMEAHCTDVRDDFNCLLEETRCLTSDSERNRNGDTLRNALKYIRDGCDTGGGSWRNSNCFIGENIKSCENSFPLGGTQYSSYNPETCRKFNLFQDCVMDSVRTRCRQEEERLMGQYLVDTAQDLAWNCGVPTSSTSSSTSSSSWDRNRDDRYYDRNGSDRDRDRIGGDRDRDRIGGDRDRDRIGGDRDRDRYGSDRGTYGSDRDRYGGDRDREYSRGDSWRERDRDREYDRGRGDSWRERDRNYGNSDVTCCRNERCSSSRMQQCRSSLSRTIDSRSSGYQDSQKCRQIRDDFNCLLWQTSNCQSRSERDQDNDIFRRAKDFISKNCDSYGRWSENSCYKSTEMQRCERSLPNTRGGAGYESCRLFNDFRDCMQSELERRCTREDELYQGAYLVDKAQELSWQCGTEQYNGKNQYFTDRREPNEYGQSNPSKHLDDDDAMCLSRVEVHSDKCKTTLEDKKRDLYITNEYEARQKINCCAIREYRSCLYDITRRVCESERSRVVDSLMGRYQYELSSENCRRIYESDCNNANHYQISMLLLFLCTLILPRIFANHLN